VGMKRAKDVLVAVVLAGIAVGVAGCNRGEPQQQAPPAGQAQQTPEVTNDRFRITLNTGGPMKMNAAPLDVTVLEDGKPVADADVSVELRMPPTAAMGEMRTGTELKPAGDGHYRGQVDMMMTGKWNAIVRVRRGGEVVATHTEPVTAQ
jgi:hypothetical protein